MKTKFLKNLLLNHGGKKPGLRASAESALAGAAKTPTTSLGSGFAFVDNSQGSSAAVAELLRSLDEALEAFDCEGVYDFFFFFFFFLYPDVGKIGPIQRDK